MKNLSYHLKFWALIILISWVSASNIIQAFKCPKMTRTELFIHLPQSVIWDFETCD